MDRDLTTSRLGREVEAFFESAYQPGSGRIVDGVEVAASPDGSQVAFTGSRLASLIGPMLTRVCLVNLKTGNMEQITRGPGSDRQPRWSPDGRQLAFLSDRAQSGVYQLYLLRSSGLGEARSTPPIDGHVEYCSWSPDGKRLLLGSAGLGALTAEGGQGRVPGRDESPSWRPRIRTGREENLWRRLWIYDAEADATQPASRKGLNVWEAVWCGDGAVAAIVSENHTEGSWYHAALALIDPASGNERVLYRSQDQLGLPACSPSGRRLAVVEAVSSDRGFIHGDVLLVDPESGRTLRLDTRGADVSSVVWRDEDHLLYVGDRAFESVVGEYDLQRDTADELWASQDLVIARNSQISPLGKSGFAMMAESYRRPPELVVGDGGQLRTVRSLAHEGTPAALAGAGRLEPVRWTAPDGLEIYGWLALPENGGPHPLVMSIHGGPVGAWRNQWMGHLRIAQPLVSRGCAVFYPNPRGSYGRGRDFARMVEGDMGGADTYDYLSGLDALVQRGIADPTRIGVTGISYGGFMACWLISQDQRFAAAVAVSIVSNWASFDRTSAIPEFSRIFLNADPCDSGGRYHQRSPVMFARRVKTPTLILAGEKDESTPPGQGIEFHSSLVECGVESVLALYPTGMHGIADFPNLTDHVTRLVGWFEDHMKGS